MVRITEGLIRKRAEHNEGLVTTLEELALHQQNIERIEALGHLCPRLKILYLQNNLIGKIQNLHKLKDLEYLNIAVNNITKVQNLQRCEALAKLDLTVNFVAKAGLLSLASLQANYNLRELHLVGNPCADWHGYRQLVVSMLPQLTRLDGEDIKQSERILARQAGPGLLQQLRAELAAEGVDPDAAAVVEDDSYEALYGEGGVVEETGHVNEKGELVRPWCPATRILEHREMERANQEAEEKKAAAKEDPFADSKPVRHETFPPLPEDGRLMQRNEGKWDFSLEESEDGSSLVLQVHVGKFLDTSLVQADVQPKFVRLLIKGRLLQLVLPLEVKPDASVAQRSKATGRLVLTMPKEDPEEAATDVTCLRPRPMGSGKAGAMSTSGRSTAAGIAGVSYLPDAPRSRLAGKQQRLQQGGSKASAAAGVKQQGASRDAFLLRQVRKAKVEVAAGGGSDDEQLPDL